MPAASDRWFGEFEIHEGARAIWQVGPLAVKVKHARREWRVCCERGDDPWVSTASVRIDAGEACDEASVDRYIVDDDSPIFALEPLLPDRPVVTRPVSPVYVPGGEAVRLYVSIPCWLRLAVGEGHKPLTEIPTVRLSDTWFGPSPIDGEFCYALRSRCRLALEADAFVPHRAILPLVVHNRAAQILLLERVNVPVPQLALFADAGGQLWTNEVGLERTEDGHFASLRLGSGAPAEARGASPVAGPREAPPRKTAIRAFSALFQS